PFCLCVLFFFFTATATPEIYTLSLHDALPIYVPQLVFVSATPGAWELRQSTRVAEQLIRPTYLVDPEVELRPTRNQIDDLLNERSEEHTSELQSRSDLVCRLLLEKKKKKK